MEPCLVMPPLAVLCLHELLVHLVPCTLQLLDLLLPHFQVALDLALLFAHELNLRAARCVEGEPCMKRTHGCDTLQPISQR